MTVADCLDLYGNEHAPTVKDPIRIAYAIDALLPVLGALTLSSISGGSNPPVRADPQPQACDCP